MEPTARYLLTGAKAPRTLIAYEQAWKNYCCYLADYDLEHSEVALGNYICALFDNDYKGSTITSKISAITYACGLNGLEDYGKSTLIKELLKGARARTKTPDTRKPFTEAILASLMRAVHWIVMSDAQQTLYKCIFAWAYYGALRVSEYTKSTLTDHNLLRQNIWPAYDTDDIVYKLRFDSYKGSADGNDCDFIMGPSSSYETCPVRLMHRYLAYRGDEPGPLFLEHGKPIKPKTVSDILAACLRFLGMDSKTYTPHSFRIGRCTQWALQGISDTEIKAKGRWNSDAHLKYVRMGEIVLL